MKRLIAYVLSIVFVLSMVVSVNAAPLKDDDFEMCFEILEKTGIVTVTEGQEFLKDEPVSRAVFSEYVGKALNVQPSFSMQYFSDVPKNHEQSGYINVLADFGVISLNDAKIFEPDRSIKYAEACKMLLCAMGYGDYALMKGVPMQTWVSVAGEAGIGISVKNADAISGEEAVKLIFKAMTEPVMVKSSDGIRVDEKTNLFAEYHNVYFDEGVVGATEDSYLERFSLLNNGRAIVGNEEFATETELSDYLGSEIEYAYKYDKDYNEGCIFFAKLKDEESVLKITSEQFKSFDEDANSFVFYKDANSSKTEKESVEKDVQIIYNGVPYEGTVTEAVEGFKDGARRGYIKLSDSDSDGSFDVVSVKSYEIMPSGTIDVQNENIYGGFDKKTIHYGDFDLVKYLGSDGEEKELVNVSDAVLCVAESENKEILEIIISTQTEYIEVKSVEADENKIIGADNAHYLVDSRVMAEYKDMLFSYKSIKAYLDVFGCIVKLEPEAKGDFSTGYLINGRYYEEDSGEFVISLNVYGKDKKISELRLAERVKIDEVSYNLAKNPKDAAVAIPNGEQSGNIIKIGPQVIRYKLNEESKITALDTVNLSQNEDINNSLTIRHKDAAMLNSNRVGLDTYWSASKTDVFKVPTLNSEGKILKNGVYVDPAASDFGTSVSLSFDETYTVDTYNYSDEDYYVGVMVVVQKASILTKDALVYTGTSTVWDEEEGAALTAVECMQGGSKASFKLNPGVEKRLENFEYGDLFYITLDGTGAYGTEIKKIFDSKTLKFIHSSTNDYWYYGEYSPYSNWSYRTGENHRNNLSKMYVLKKRNEAVFGSYEYSGLEKGIYEEIMRIGSIPVVIVDSENETVEKGSFESILSYEEVGEDASLILIESLTQVAKSVIIYK